MHREAVLTCVADPTRLEILRILTEKECAVGQLVDETGRAQSLVSYHLRRLRECGLVERRRQGPHRFYRISRPQIRRAVEAMEAAARETRSLCRHPACGGSP